MTGRKIATSRGVGVRRTFGVSLVAICVLLGVAAIAAPRNVSPPASPPAAPAQAVPAQAVPAAATPAATTQPVATPAAAGLCQCIADHDAIRMSCLGSASACQSVCASTRYSFRPDAEFSCSAAGQAGPSR